MGQEQAYDLCVTSTDESRAQDLVKEIQNFASASVPSDEVVDNNLVTTLPSDKLDELQDLAKKHMVGVKINGSKLLLYGMAEDIARARHDVMAFLRTCHSARWSSGERMTDDYLEIDSISGYVEDAFQHNRRYTLFTSQSGKDYRLKVKDVVKIRLLPDKREIRLHRRMSITYDDIPNTWTPHPHEVVDTVPVEGEELDRVTSLFETNRKSKSEIIDVRKVYRIQNRLLHKKYKASEETLALQNGRDKVNECRLYHGTSVEAVEMINKMDLTEVTVAKMTPNLDKAPTFLSTHPTHQETHTRPQTQRGLKYVYQAKVLTGIPVEGYPKMKYLPLRDGKSTPYDSAVNNLKAIDAYAIFKDDQAYPEYLITFTVAAISRDNTPVGKTRAGSRGEQNRDSSIFSTEL
ncbi:protein mono-ADP-ribosyltransferase PARP14-like [Haliotis rubra]|uniref:protein mono-ADP-ribosyltransferase PARP14-like n=1 Tax=Haliotis rubra TaxID=36100 RepID=UPI001EE54ED1|nr:protein mono-ADP-ribosyltransferase PARP14-like [Haliotis rubra]